MSHEWRLLYDDIHEARHHFAVEEALARLIDEGHSPPTLRMRQVHPAVFVGVYQNTWDEVDVAYCQANNIQIVRRANGGGAVYHEMGSFCFSAFIERDYFSQSEEELYHLFAAPAIHTCADFGVVAHFHGRNDVLAGQRKIYGSAQMAWYNAFVQSGTFLVNIDFEKMERALTPPRLKFAGKSAHNIRERVTSLSQEVGHELDTCQIMEQFADHVSDVLNIHLLPGDLSSEEQTLAAELLSVKYGTDAWNFGDRKEYQVTVAGRNETGVISLSVDMKGEIIQTARLNGDLLLSNRDEFENLERSLRNCSLHEAQAAVQNTALPSGIRENLFGLVEKLSQEVADLSKAENKESQI